MDPLLAWSLFQRASEVAARIALGDGLSRVDVAASLRNLADAVETQDCAEDMSPMQHQLD